MFILCYIHLINYIDVKVILKKNKYMYLLRNCLRNYANEIKF